LRLYIAGLTPRSTKAIQNIRKICEEHLEGRYDLQVVDIYQQPVLAEGEQIIAAPTLIKLLPLPLRRFIGDMSNTERILVGMDLRTAEEKRAAAERTPEKP
jgi:circadian clock protein KaiB